MSRIRTLVRTRSEVGRLLLTFVITFLSIAGLLAMHTFTGTTGGGHPQTAAGSVSASGADSRSLATPAIGGMLVTTVVTDPGAAVTPCQGDCDDSGGMLDHAMLMVMACVLALLSVAIVLSTPALLARRSTSLAALRLHGQNLVAALPTVRPPSLIVLSISRT